jgi:hypothetical protein
MNAYEGIIEDLGIIPSLPEGANALPAALPEVVEYEQPVVERRSNRLKVLEWAAGAAALLTAGVVVERLQYKHAH